MNCPNCNKEIIEDPAGTKLWHCPTCKYAWKFSELIKGEAAMNKYFIIELEPGVYAAPWLGDPGRTIRKINAKRFPAKGSAETSLNHIKQNHANRFNNAKIVETDAA